MNPLRSREQFGFLVLANIAYPIAWSVWQALLNNYVIEDVGFTGYENGVMQSLREIPGFLAFTSVYVLLLIREQNFLISSLAVFGLGVALIGLFPTPLGVYCTVVLMSVGFHYMEICKQSLSLQWIPKADAPRLLGKLVSYAAAPAFLTYCSVWALLTYTSISYSTLFMIGGGIVVGFALLLKTRFRVFESKIPQQKQVIVRSRYWLYYCLTLLSGARRQIFVAFAGFLLVERFGYSAAEMTVLMLVNHVFNYLFAEKIGAWIGRVKERNALIVEYLGLIVIFVSYAYVQVAWVAAVLFVLDNLLFVMAIAIKTYFQKIADPKEIAGSTGLSFTVNHIAAVVIPALLGYIWLTSVAAVFLIGAGFALVSLFASMLVPTNPRPGNEVAFGKSSVATGH